MGPERRGGDPGRRGIEPEQVVAPRQIGRAQAPTRARGGAAGCGPPPPRIGGRLRTRPAETRPGSARCRPRRQPRTARTGPLVPRQRERCRSAKAARVEMRPTVRAGMEASDGETVAPLEPPRLQDGPARPGGHPLAEPMGLGPFPGVGLVSALHVDSAFRDARRVPASDRRRVRAAAFGGTFQPTAASPSMLGDIPGSPLVGKCLTVYLHPIPVPRIVPKTVGRRGGRRGDRTER